MATLFSLGILCGDKPQLRPPAQTSPGWDIAEIPVALQLNPFDSDAL